MTDFKKKKKIINKNNRTTFIMNLYRHREGWFPATEPPSSVVERNESKERKLGEKHLYASLSLSHQ